MDSMYVSVIGDVELFKKCIKDYEKIKIVLVTDDPKVDEFAILQILHEDSKKLDAKILYFHAKGTSYPKMHKHFENLQDWRRYMEYFLIYNYKKCIESLKNHDVCGVNWWDGGKYPPHFSGNFWWTKMDYIKKLSKPVPGSWGRRDAEFWIGTGQPRTCNLFSSGINHYTTPYNKINYRY
jgi:hypothetical protein